MEYLLRNTLLLLEPPEAMVLAWDLSACIREEHESSRVGVCT
uniref:Uncharacterized protein n=1 Tax=Manihot esculenta TaxID=3983 RepID=A0A2C9UTQ2_MANES